MRPITREVLAFVEAFVNAIPGRTGYRCRAWYFRRRLRRLGPNAIIGPGLQVFGPGRVAIGGGFSCWRHCTIAACEDGTVEIGDGVSLNANVYINACIGGRIVIGNDVLIAPNVVLRSSDHATDDVDLPIKQQGHVAREIIVEDDVWLGANVTVVGGVRIGRGAVVGAGAVVTRDVPPYMIVGGVPARPIRPRGSPSGMRQTEPSLTEP